MIDRSVIPETRFSLPGCGFDRPSTLFQPRGTVIALMRDGDTETIVCYEDLCRFWDRFFWVEKVCYWWGGFFFFSFLIDELRPLRVNLDKIFLRGKRSSAGLKGEILEFLSVQNWSYLAKFALNFLQICRGKALSKLERWINFMKWTVRLGRRIRYRAVGCVANSLYGAF